MTGSDALIDRTVSHYRIIKQLGRGGMGEVYLAEDKLLGRKVAIKFLPADLATDDHARQRLLREAKTAATLDHPSICAIYEVGEFGCALCVGFLRHDSGCRRFRRCRPKH